MNDIKFGEMLKNLRKGKGISMANFIKDIGISRTYLVEVEKGILKPPTQSRQVQIAEYLKLTDGERKVFYDIAAKERNELPADILEYVDSKPEAIEMFRELIAVNKLKGVWQWK